MYVTIHTNNQSAQDDQRSEKKYKTVRQLSIATIYAALVATIFVTIMPHVSENYDGGQRFKFVTGNPSHTQYRYFDLFVA